LILKLEIRDSKLSRLALINANENLRIVFAFPVVASTGSGTGIGGYSSTPTSPLQMYNSPTPGAYEYTSPQHQQHHPPLKHQQSSTLGQWSDIAGVPFVLHEDLQSSIKNPTLVIPFINSI